MVNRLLASALALCAASSAHAAIITVSGSFTATNWSVYFDTPTPAIDPLYLDYSATYDDAVVYLGDTSVLTINSTNIPYAFNFSYDGGGGALIFATTPIVSGCTHTAGSFCAFVDPLSGQAVFVEQSPETGGGWVANTITQGVPVVPEPSTWAMMIGGFGIAGAAIRRRRVTYGTKALAA